MQGPQESEVVQDEQTRRLGEMPVGRLLWSFTLPALAGMIVGSLYTVLDRAFLGQVVGPDALAGLSLCMPIAFVMMAFGVLLGLGSGALVSLRLGEGKKAEAEKVLGNTFTLAIIISIVLSAVFLVALDPLLVAFGASAQTLPYARQFLRVILFGSFFQYTGFGLNSIIRAEGNPRLAMLTMLLNAGMNILLDALFVLVFKWGVTGAAVATVISQGLGAGWTLWHFGAGRHSVLKLRLRYMRLRWEIISPALAIGLSPFSMHLAASAINLVINRGLARYGGDRAISAYGIIASLAMLFLMPVFGINQGAQPVLGFNFGARRLERVLATLKIAAIAATIVTTLGFVLTELVPIPMLRLFTQDEQLLEVGARGMRICLAMLPVVGFQIVSANFFQAIGRAKISLVLGLLRQVVLLLPLLIVLPPAIGLDGVWGAGPVADGLASLITAFFLLRELKALKRAELKTVPAPA